MVGSRGLGCVLPPPKKKCLDKTLALLDPFEIPGYVPVSLSHADNASQLTTHGSCFFEINFPALDTRESPRARASNETAAVGKNKKTAGFLLINISEMIEDRHIHRRITTED